MDAQEQLKLDLMPAANPTAIYWSVKSDLRQVYTPARIRRVSEIADWLPEGSGFEPSRPFVFAGFRDFTRFPFPGENSRRRNKKITQLISGRSSTPRSSF
jgi:hypothetical protein